METIFNKITKLNDKVFAEKNRNILLSDYVQKTEPTLEVTDSLKNNGKKIRVFSTYEMKYDVIKELTEFYNQIKKDSESVAVPNYSNFELAKSIEIDFRGCKTQKQKDDKIEKAVTDTQEEFNQRLEMALATKISRLNETFNNHINYNINEFISHASNILTDQKVYESDFEQDEELAVYNIKYNETVEKINGLSSIKEELERQLTDKKRQVVLNVLKEEEYKITVNGSKIELPKLVIERVKQDILKAFGYEKTYYIG